MPCAKNHGGIEMRRMMKCRRRKLETDAGERRGCITLREQTAGSRMRRERNEMRRTGCISRLAFDLLDFPGRAAARLLNVGRQQYTDNSVHSLNDCIAPQFLVEVKKIQISAARAAPARARFFRGPLSVTVAHGAGVKNRREVTESA